MEHLLPDALFQSLSTPALALLAVVGLAALSRGADWLVESATELAEQFGLPKIIIGATLLSLGTTAPECAVSVMAAVQGEPGLALGNAVGSVIVDTAVIFGLLSMFTRLPADKFILSRQGWWQFGSAALLAVLTYILFWKDGESAVISRPVGFALLGLLVLYMAMSVRWARQHKAMELAATEVATTDTAEAMNHPPIWSSVLWMGLGLSLVLFAGRVAVASVSIAAERVGVPDVIIASTFVAFGTSLPELIVGWTAVKKGHGEILVGNVIGADVLNILFVVGAAAAATPLPILAETEPRTVFMTVQIPTMLLALIYFRFCIARATRIGSFDRWMGIPLLVLYVAFAIAQIVTVSAT